MVKNVLFRFRVESEEFDEIKKIVGNRNLSEVFRNFLHEFKQAELYQKYKEGDKNENK